MTEIILAENKLLKERCEAYEKAIEDIRSELHKTAEKHEDGDWYLRYKWVDEIIDQHMAKMK